MSEKRRDNRNRVLRNGESQRPDGRYQFKYQDNDGKVKFVYSWRLDKNDRTPAGKKRELSLREKEKQIEHDLFDRIVPNGGHMTVLELVQKYVSLKTGVRHNTMANYNFVINIIAKESFGRMRIYKVQLPKITPHVCRHTFCSKMAKSGMNPKTLQYIMGHSDISVTLNTYSHVGSEDAKEELSRVALG